MAIVDPTTLQFTAISKSTADKSVSLVWHAPDLTDDLRALMLMQAGVLMEKATRANISDGLIKHGTFLLEVSKAGGMLRVVLFQQATSPSGAPSYEAVVEYLDEL
jgi:hypothetical protein